MSSEAILGYWEIRGLAQQIRFLLEYTGTPYKEDVYRCGPAPDYDRSAWTDKKEDLGVTFPNLPYYFDGNLKITQSNAIMRHIARQHNLCGKTEEEKVRVDIMENQLMDYRNRWTMFCYYPVPDFEIAKPKYIQQFHTEITKLSDYLGDRKWISGDEITFPDFVLYELLYIHKRLDPNLLKDTPNLQKLMDRFEALQPIRNYLKSPRFKKLTLNNPSSKFGGKSY